MVLQRTSSLLLWVALTLTINADSNLLEFGSGASLPSHWAVKVKNGRADVTVRTVLQRRSVCLVSDSSSFSIQRKTKIDTRVTPRLTWTWLVEQLPANGDLRDRRRDDQAAQLFVVFSDGRAISYVWDSNAPILTRGRTYIPLVVDVRIVVVQSGAADIGEWVPMSRNVREDYRQLFGDPPPDRVVGVRFQINSQYTRTRATSCLAAVAFGA